MAEAVARHAATVIPERKPYYKKWAQNLKVRRDRRFKKQQTLLEGVKVTNWPWVKKSAESDERRGKTTTDMLWDEMEWARPGTKEGRDAKSKEIEQELKEHERKLKIRNNNREGRRQA